MPHGKGWVIVRRRRQAAFNELARDVTYNLSKLDASQAGCVGGGRRLGWRLRHPAGQRRSHSAQFHLQAAHARPSAARPFFCRPSHCAACCSNLSTTNHPGLSAPWACRKASSVLRPGCPGLAARMDFWPAPAAVFSHRFLPRLRPETSGPPAPADCSAFFPGDQIEGFGISPKPQDFQNIHLPRNVQVFGQAPAPFVAPIPSQDPLHFGAQAALDWPDGFCNLVVIIQGAHMRLEILRPRRPATERMHLPRPGSKDH